MPCGRGPDFIQSYLFLLYGVLPQTLVALRAGPISGSRNGEKTAKGANPLWEPLRANKQRLAAAQAKRQACLRNRSLVVPDKVPPADLYVESEPSFDAWLQLAHKHKKSKHSLGVPLVRPLEQSIQHMAEGAPKGGAPLWIPPRANAQRIASARDQRTVPLAQPLFGCPYKVPPAELIERGRFPSTRPDE